MNNKFQAMEVFVQVVDLGGFRRAADQMKLPAVTVSTLIKNLESTLAVKLLHRTTRNVSLTPDGATYYEHCLQILAQVKEAEEALCATRMNPRGRLRVDAPTGLASEVLVPALPDFFLRYPGIRLELGCSDRWVDLIGEGVDCAVRGGELVDPNLIARRVGVMHYVTCASPDYLKRHGTPAHPDELATHHCLDYFSARTAKIYDWDFTRNGERIQITPHSQFGLNDSYAYAAAGVAGLGIVQMANFLMEPMIKDGRLVSILDDWSNEPMPIHVVYPQNRHLSSKVRVFVDWISELFANHPSMHVGRRSAKE